MQEMDVEKPYIEQAREVIGAFVSLVIISGSFFSPPSPPLNLMPFGKILLTAAFLFMNLATAQPVPEVLVTGTVIDDATVFDRLPREVITAEDIAILSPSSTVALLRSIPGVDVTQQGGEGGITTVSLRGGDPNFTVVMIDGVKVDDPTNSRGGGYDFAGLDPLMIERIEVLFGSYSAVYGSDALAGVISVTTRSQGSLDGATIDVEAGTDDARAAAVNMAGSLTGNLRGALSAAIRQGNEAVEGDTLERKQVSGQPLSHRNRNRGAALGAALFRLQGRYHVLSAGQWRRSTGRYPGSGNTAIRSTDCVW